MTAVAEYAAAGETPVNAPAFYDFLKLLSVAVLLAESGDAPGALIARHEAELAAEEAFPAGSADAQTLRLILAAAGRVTAEVAE